MPLPAQRQQLYLVMHCMTSVSDLNLSDPSAGAVPASAENTQLQHCADTLFSCLTTTKPHLHLLDIECRHDLQVTLKLCSHSK